MSVTVNDARGVAPAPRMQITPVRAYADLSHFGLIHISGTDAEAFLQGQLSCDVARLGDGRAQYGSYNTPKGRMLASFLLWGNNDAGYFMQLPRELCAPIAKRLSMYVLRSKVSVRNVSDDFCKYGIYGEFAENAIQPLFATLPSMPLGVITAGGASLLRIDAVRVQVVAPILRGMELSAMLGRNLAIVDTTMWDLMNIRAGVPYVLPATQDQFVPQMANLDLIDGVSFSKGCYPGQEIVARMHYLGKLKQRMYLAHVASDPAPEPGDKLYSADTGEQATGMIMNVAPTPESGYDVLAVIHIASYLRGDVRLQSPDGRPLKFMALPYEPALSGC